jgi:Fe-S oxidoreductase
MLCGSCEDRCYPVKQLHPLWVFELLREQAVEDEWAPLEWFSRMLSNLEQHDNPYGVPAEERILWEEGLEIKNALEEKVEYLLFVGDDYSSFESLRERIRAVAELLKKGGVDFGTLGKAEVSSGSAVLLIGDRDYFWAFAEANMENFKKAGVEKIITADAHAYAVLSEEYTKLGDIKVFHISQIISELLKNGNLKFDKRVEMKAAYHDPCRIGRRHGIFDQPRQILRSIDGVELLEFERNRKNSLCCGGGGSVFFWEPEFAKWVGKERLFEAEFVGAEAIITACPICVRMLEEAAKDRGGKTKIFDLAEVCNMAC